MSPMNPRLLRPLTTGFDPRNLSGLVAWYDASDLQYLAQTSSGATAATADNDPVAYWAPRFGSAVLTQTVNNNRPALKLASVNGRASLAFDGSNDRLSNATLNLTLANAFTLCAVLKYNVPATGHQIPVAFTNTDGFGSPSFGGGTIEINRTGNTFGAVVGSRLAANENAVNGGTPTSAAVAHLVRFDNPTISLFTNGTSRGTATRTQAANSDSGLFVGAYATGILPANINACEIVYYSRALTDSEITRLQRYFAARWGL